MRQDSSTLERAALATLLSRGPPVTEYRARKCLSAVRHKLLLLGEISREEFEAGQLCLEHGISTRGAAMLQSLVDGTSLRFFDGKYHGKDASLQGELDDWCWRFGEVYKEFSKIVASARVLIKADINHLPIFSSKWRLWNDLQKVCKLTMHMFITRPLTMRFYFDELDKQFERITALLLRHLENLDFSDALLDKAAQISIAILTKGLLYKYLWTHMKTRLEELLGPEAVAPSAEDMQEIERQIHLGNAGRHLLAAIKRRLRESSSDRFHSLDHYLRNYQSTFVMLQQLSGSSKHYLLPTYQDLEISLTGRRSFGECSISVLELKGLRSISKTTGKRLPNNLSPADARARIIATTNRIVERAAEEFGAIYVHPWGTDTWYLLFNQPLAVANFSRKVMAQIRQDPLALLVVKPVITLNWGEASEAVTGPVDDFSIQSFLLADSKEVMPFTIYALGPIIPKLKAIGEQVQTIFTLAIEGLENIDVAVLLDNHINSNS